MVFAEIITIGDEILYGQITDTNSQFIATELDKIGVKISRKSSVGDNQEHILQALTEARNRADIILMTGGLGPTKDDITKKTLCEFFDTHLILNEQALAEVSEFFISRGRELTETNRQQAMIPANCTFISNKFGTAPGMWFENEGKIFISMPGVPREMIGLMQTEMLPRLQKHFKTSPIFHKFIKTTGIGESFLADKIEDWENNLPPHIKLAYLPSYGQVRLRLTATGGELGDLQAAVQQQIDKLLPLVAEFVYGYDTDELENTVGKLLVSQQKTISLAESCTGGFVSHLLTKVAGSSAYFIGGVVAYSNEIKTNDLGVNPETINNFGAVSEETVKEMAENIRKKFKTAIGLAVSGIAGPDGGTPEKPVGTVWICYADKSQTVAKKLQLLTEREVNIKMSANALLNLLRLNLLRNP
ncbi:MAG: competence/damage-inducible protein A [Verrucomicrobia bacterium]|nr:competence/damage-inducible protein A [Cytophagales bacterium]